MADKIERYFPRVTEFNRRFWVGLKGRKFQSTRCQDCQRVSFPPHVLCPYCFSGRYEWVVLSGRATLYAFTRHEIVPRAFVKEAPYLTGMVDLVEGPRILCRIENTRYEDLRPGMSLKVGFAELNEEMAIYYFEPEKR